MKPSEKKIVKLLIQDVIDKQDPAANNIFQISLYNLLKEIEQSINLYIKKEQLNISRSEKENLIIKELKAFVTLKVTEYYKNLDEEIKGTETDENDYEEDDDDIQDGALPSDDPTGPNF